MLFLSGGLAGRTVLDTAEAQFRDGRWLAAAALARCDDSAAGFALAARSTLVAASLTADKRRRDRLLDLAIRDVEKALERDPDHLETQLQAAAAYGFRAQLRRSANDVERSRRHVERALALAPGDPLALAALGYWHGRTVLGAGAFFARIFFGARKRKAIAAFEAALAKAPDNLVIRAGFGRLLLRFEDEESSERGLAELARAATITSRTALEKEMKRQAELLLAAARKGANRHELARLADRLAPFSD
ncbi:MAG: hypothetical protein D6807_00460 [Alphaproteobacteria bacterium]|nr:MAG: hypothetical protein D6807_00460 [Alphaproteobacteria bacterium]